MKKLTVINIALISFLAIPDKAATPHIGFC